MLRLISFTIFFSCTSFVASAQINDSLPWLKLPERITTFEEIVGPLSPRQEAQISTQMLELFDRNRYGRTSAPLRQQRQRLERSIIGVLNETQKANLRSETEGGQSPMQTLLNDFPPRRRE